LILTDKARAVLEDMTKIAQGLRGDAFKEIPAAELRRTKAVLEHIKENLLALDKDTDMEHKT
jgi:hypothetical protein